MTRWLNRLQLHTELATNCLLTKGMINACSDRRCADKIKFLWSLKIYEGSWPPTSNAYD